MKNLKIKGLARQLGRFVLLSTIAVAATTAQHVSAQIVTNGDFQTNDSSFSGYAGYAGFPGSPNQIPGFDRTGYAGVEGYDVPGSRPFFPANYTTGVSADPRDFAFVQEDGSELTQTVSLNQLTNYTLTFKSATRQGNPTALGTVSVQIGSMTYSVTTNPIANPNVSAVNGFNSYSLNLATGLNQTSGLLTP